MDSWLAWAGHSWGLPSCSWRGGLCSAPSPASRPTRPLCIMATVITRDTMWGRAEMVIILPSYLAGTWAGGHRVRLRRGSLDLASPSEVRWAAARRWAGPSWAAAWSWPWGCRGSRRARSCSGAASDRRAPSHLRLLPRLLGSPET